MNARMNEYEMLLIFFSQKRSTRYFFNVGNYLSLWESVVDLCHLSNFHRGLHIVLIHATLAPTRDRLDNECLGLGCENVIDVDVQIVVHLMKAPPFHGGDIAGVQATDRWPCLHGEGVIIDVLVSEDKTGEHDTLGAFGKLWEVACRNILQCSVDGLEVTGR